MADNPISRAKQLVREWKAQRRDQMRTPSFKHLSNEELIRLAECPGKMNCEEAEALAEAWDERFGFTPFVRSDQKLTKKGADDNAEPRRELPPGDTMLDAKEVCRLTGLSLSTLKRMVTDGRFPKPMRPSKRRIMWPARDVQGFVDTMEEQRSNSLH